MKKHKIWSFWTLSRCLSFEVQKFHPYLDGDYENKKKS